MSTLALTMTILAAALCLNACQTGAWLSDLRIVHDGGWVRLSNPAVKVRPGEEYATATGAGYNLKTKKGYVTYAHGYRADYDIVGAGHVGGRVWFYTHDEDDWLAPDQNCEIHVNVLMGSVKNFHPHGPTTYVKD